jgi:hypothetical protein
MAAYAFGLLYEGFMSEHYAGLLTFTFADKEAAGRAYSRLGPDASNADRDLAVQRLIRADPANPQGWDAAAYDDALEHGRLTVDGLRDLDRSYALSFFDRTGAVWRVGFALDHWGELTPQLRLDAEKEANDALKEQGINTQLAERMQSIRSPEGQLAAVLIRAQAAGR